MRSAEKIRFIKYSENGVFAVKEIEKLNKGTDSKAPQYPEIEDSCLCHTDKPVLAILWKVYISLCKIFKANQACVCGEAHY